MRKKRKLTWEKPEYTKDEVNWAGKVVSGRKKVSHEDEERAMVIFENWRACHNYPLHIFYMRLKKYSEDLHTNSIVAQRLKRTPSIIQKLKRGYNNHKPSMNLYQMQDIGGCRAIVPNVKLARKLYEEKFLRGDLKHKKSNQKDYVHFPKEDGYRGLHLVYNYQSDKNRVVFNDLKIEIQIRTKLQHLWATGIETIDFITQQAMKFGKGRSEWSEFFLLVSSAFSDLEGYPFLENTPNNKDELYRRIKEKEDELKAIDKLKGFTYAFREYTEQKKKNKKEAKFFLLELSMVKDNKRLIITEYGNSEEEKEKAIKDYGMKEKEHKDDLEYDVVLVSVDDVKNLKRAYPKYFADTKELIEELDRIISLVK
ncbi:MAG: RelA/SpoT domain-containing protein [Nanoarchaeota archaeon]|mgnify:CR=1 FL=1